MRDAHVQQCGRRALTQPRFSKGSGQFLPIKSAIENTTSLYRLTYTAQDVPGLDLLKKSLLGDSYKVILVLEIDRH